MFKSITNLISGRNRHWNQAYDPYIELVHQKATRLPANISSFFVDVTASSACITSLIIGYGTNSNTQILQIISKDIKSITPLQFQTAHNLNMWTLIATIASIKLPIRDLIFSNGEKLIGIKQNEMKIVEEIMKLSNPDFNQIAMIVYPHLAVAFDYDDYGTSFFKCAALAPTLSIASSNLLDKFNH